MEHIVTSQPQAGPFTLAKNEQKALTFNFDSPIPINAWNVSLQVVYRGAMGTDNDAVVVSTKEISAPTYFDAMNMLDYYESAPTFIAPQPVNLTQRVNYGLSGIDAQNGVYREYARIDGLPLGSYSRWAVLANRDNYQHRMDILFNLCNSCTTPIPQLSTRVLETSNLAWNYTTNTLDFRVVTKSRGKYRFRANSFRVLDGTIGPQFNEEYNADGTIYYLDPQLLAEDLLPPFRVPNPVPLTSLNF